MQPREQPPGDAPHPDNEPLSPHLLELSHATLGCLAHALGWMFWGLMVQMAALGVVGLAVYLGAPAVGWAKPLWMLGIFSFAVGGLVVLRGQWQCYDLPLPDFFGLTLPGQRCLRASFWSHMGAYVVELARTALPQWSPGTLRVLLGGASTLLLVLFLREMARVLGRSDLRRQCDQTLGLAVGGGAALLGVFVCGILLEWHWGAVDSPAELAGVCVAVLGVAAILASVPSYVSLLWQMREGVLDFQQHLESLRDDIEDEWPDQDHAEEPEEEPVAD